MNKSDISLDNVSTPVFAKVSQRALKAILSGKGWHFYKDKSGKWRWNHRSNNGNIVGASSQGFARKAGAVKNAVLNGYVK